MIAVLLLALLSADPGDAGITAVTLESLYAACPAAPPLQVVDGGYFTPELRQQRENCKVAALEAFVVPRLETDPVGPPNPGVVITLVAGGLVVLGGGVALGYLLPHPK